jgi:LmbE family N-acetylglucosaminyl deacetylase
MLNLNFHTRSDDAINVLCLGAHCDDIEIGCGGTLLKLIEQYKKAHIYWVVFSSDEVRAREARESASMFLRNAGTKSVVIKNYTMSFFPYVGSELKAYFEQLKQDFSPDVIFTHYRNDLHQDHRVISDLTWNSYRSHLIFEYEIPKYDGDMGSPNSFVPLDKSTVQKKIGFIMESFRSQRDKQWFDEETFRAVMRLRGVESNAPDKYAEGFYCRKMTLA